jgi:hypothetical protein
MHRVQTNAELEALHVAGAGFVFNHFTSGPAGARDNVLHMAGCPWVRRMLDGAKPLVRPPVRKMFFDTLDEAQSWLVPTLGPEGRGWKRCTGRRPGRMAAGNNMRLPAGTPSANVREADGGTGAMSPAGPVAAPGSWPVHAAFAMPGSQPLRLPVPPRLASWNKAGDADQVRLARYLATAGELLRPHYARLTGPLALRLDVGLPQAAGLPDQRDLDNYLLPLATRLSQSTPGAFTCVWGTKQHSASSFVRIEQAVPAPAAPSFDCCYTVRTDTSSQSEKFKEQIRDQLATARPLPPGPVGMQLCFTLGPGRNWLNLWKPVIDALGQILGRAPAAGSWSPLDGASWTLACTAVWMPPWAATSSSPSGLRTSARNYQIRERASA